MVHSKARDNGHKTGWLFIPERLLVDEWLGKAESRDFRRKMFEALEGMGTVPPYDNAPVIIEMQKKRHACAQLPGYPSYAGLAREGGMITDLTRVNSLLDDLIAKALPKFEADMRALEQFSANNNGPARLEPWDVPYWVNRQRTALYDFDANAFSAHLEVKNVSTGMLNQATQMFNITFTEVFDQPTMHHDIQVYAVTDSTSKDLVGYLHIDMYARPNTKSGGAWMSGLQDQDDGRPVVIIFNMNLQKPSADGHTLVDLEQYKTCYHELGHCLQGLLSMNVKHISQQGTNGPSDFVEIHAMINERRALLRDNLKTYALHYQTGQPPSDAAIDALLKSQTFFATLNALRMAQNSRRDLAFHSLDPARGLSAQAIEDSVAINSPYARHLRTYGYDRFDHLFGEAHSSYAAGYVNYLLAELHAAHGFVPFENDPYNKEQLDRINAFYRRGCGGVHLDVYRAFRGEDATADAMLKDMGIGQDTQAARASAAARPTS